MEIEGLIAQLGVPHRAKPAFRTLLGMGVPIVPAILKSLRDENAEVRRYCCSLLDHLVTPEAFGDLLGMLEDSSPSVRLSALHALACDRCKEGDWRPSAEDILPPALRLLRTDADYHVRAMAIEVVGLFVHSHSQALQALAEVQMQDPSPAVRKKARWYLPGGAIYQRTSPRPIRNARQY